MSNSKLHALDPHDQIRQAGDFYFISGQVGTYPNTKIALKNAGAQAAQALNNIGHILRYQGLKFDDIVKTTIFVKDMADVSHITPVYQCFFSTPQPAYSCVGVADLPHEADGVELLVEIEAVALKASAGTRP